MIPVILQTDLKEECNSVGWLFVSVWLLASWASAMGCETWSWQKWFNASQKTRPRSWVTSHSKGFFNVLAANRQQNIAAIGRTTELTETFVAGCPWFFPISFALMRVRQTGSQPVTESIPCNSSATFFLCPSTEWLLSESQQAENRQWSWKKDFLNKYILYFIILHLTIVFLSWCGLSIYGLQHVVAYLKWRHTGACSSQIKWSTTYLELFPSRPNTFINQYATTARTCHPSDSARSPWIRLRICDGSN